MSILANELNNNTELVKKYKFKIDYNLMKMICTLCDTSIEIYSEYKKNDAYYMDVFDTNALFLEVIEKYNYFNNFHKPVGIEDTEFSFFLKQHDRYINILNNYFKNGNCKFKIKNLIYSDKYSFDDVKKIVLIFYELKQIEKNMYEFRDYKNEMLDILDSLSYILTSKQLEIVRNEYIKLSNDPSELKKLKTLIKKINEITKQDYINKLSCSDENNYSFIVHSIKTSTWNGKFYDPLVSASLINNEVKGLYSMPCGFVLDPSSMVSASSDDTYTSNSMYGNSFSITSDVPVIYSYDKIINDCKKRKKENPKDKIYNEIVLTHFNPIAIFYYPGNLEMAINLKKQIENIYPNLEVIEIGSKIKRITSKEGIKTNIR